MSFKYVYALISSEKDHYTEQAVVSMHSLRFHDPDVHISLVTNNATFNTFKDKRTLIKKYVNEFIIVNPPESFTPIQQSRFLKTTLRQNVKGDFLYLDNDTIVSASLHDLESIDCEMGAVPDGHRTAECNGQMHEYFRLTKRSWNYNLYFNGGVLLVRDTVNTHKFFGDWHRIWNEDRIQYGINIDQPALAQADLLNDCLIAELDGRYNCQVVLSGAKKYLTDAAVFHYMSDLAYFASFPLKNLKLLNQVRENGITAEIEEIMHHPLHAFLENSLILGGAELEIYKSPLMILARKRSRDHGWLNKVVRFAYRLLGYKI